MKQHAASKTRDPGAITMAAMERVVDDIAMGNVSFGLSRSEQCLIDQFYAAAYVRQTLLLQAISPARRRARITRPVRRGRSPR